LTIHIIHISDKRMIAQGTDGCSRGSLMEGMMAREDMLTFVDLALPVTERHPPLLDWVRLWTNCPGLLPLSPEGWFEEGYGITGGVLDQNNVWIPMHEAAGEIHSWSAPPAVADAALEELLKAWHKRTNTFHVLLIPHLMTLRWRRLFNKACDFLFVVSPGSSFWSVKMYKLLWVGIVLPFTKHRPWYLRQALLLVEIGRSLRVVLETCEANARDHLRKHCFSRGAWTPCCSVWHAECYMCPLAGSTRGSQWQPSKTSRGTCGTRRRRDNEDRCRELRELTCPLHFNARHAGTKTLRAENPGTEHSPSGAIWWRQLRC